MKGICCTCGKEFEKSYFEQKYCSRQCTKTFDVSIHKKCKICGSDFIAHRVNQEYCTIRCRKISAKEISRKSATKVKENNNGSIKLTDYLNAFASNTCKDNVIKKLTTIYNLEEAQATKIYCNWRKFYVNSRHA